MLLRFRASSSDRRLNGQLMPALGCVTDAVAGFLALNSLMKARVMSMLSAA